MYILCADSKTCGTVLGVEAVWEDSKKIDVFFIFLICLISMSAIALFKHSEWLAMSYPGECDSLGSFPLIRHQAELSD